MKITWVVENNRFQERGYDDLLNILNSLCYHYEDVRVFDGLLDDEMESKIADIGNPIIPLGSWNLMEVAIKKGWKPGVFLNDNFCMTEIRRHYSVLNQTFDVRNLLNPGELPNQFFAKPNNDGKIFPGQVFTWSSFQLMRDRLLGYGVNIDIPIIVSSVQETLREFRFFVVDKKIITGSQYKEGVRKVTNSFVPIWIYDFAVDQISKWCPSDCFVIDIADVNGQAKVIEVNCINCSGFYECNVRSIVGALSSYVLKDGEKNGS